MRLLNAMFLVCLLILSAGASAMAADTVVLDTAGNWRMFQVLKMPVIADGATLTPVPVAGAESDGWKVILKGDTAPAPALWQTVDSDDSRWVRGPARKACRTPYLARLCLRGKFTVTDPAKVAGLRLSVGYHGGIRVMLNGQEIARENLPAGDLGEDVVATAYPQEAFVDEKGGLLQGRGELLTIARANFSDEAARRIGLRERKLDVDLPAKGLRAGLNLLAIEIIRSPYDKVVDKFQVEQGYKSKQLTHDLTWNTCEIRRVQLTATQAAGLTVGAVRPQGVQVWNSDPLDTDFDADFGDPSEPLYPVRLAGARGGTYSGKVVVGSAGAIKGLSAVPGDLKATDGSIIPAVGVRIRYAMPWDRLPVADVGTFNSSPYPTMVTPLMALDEKPLAEFPVRQKEARKIELSKTQLGNLSRQGALELPLQLPNQPAVVAGAVVPVWVTVRIPDQAKPGVYTGKVAVTVAGKRVADVPVEVTVADWTLPDVQDRRAWVELIQSPETVALEYQAPLWSAQHFQLIARSFRFMNEIGSRVVYVPLIAQSNLGNEESMVRWVKGPNGSYDYDFTIMDKYLDTATQSMGKPKVVVFYVWDLYLAADSTDSGPRQEQLMSGAMKRGAKIGAGPRVTVVDAAGKPQTVELPAYGSPESKPQWSRLFAELRKRMAARGLEGTMMLGMLTDAWPGQGQVEFLNETSSGLPWVSGAHGRVKAQKGVHGIADCGYQAHAFGSTFGFTASLAGWNNQTLNTNFERWGNIPHSVIGRWRSIVEYSLTGNMRGIGRLGGDFWPVLKDKSGRRLGQVWERYPEVHWRVLNIATSLLAPGQDGAVATTRYEALREGAEECEARIVLEEALLNEASKKKLGPDLAVRCEKALAERHLAMYRSLSHMQVGPGGHLALGAWRGWGDNIAGYTWFMGSNWQQRSLTVYSLAGEVARKLKQ